MRSIHLVGVALLVAGGCVGCAPAGVPQPIKVMENPQTGERARFFKEIDYKVPPGYDEKKHIAQWTIEQEKLGFTREITPGADRERLAELRAKNLAAK